MTDTASPITEPHLTPMFATGGQPALSPNTEPHPAPIFDTGPHPDPLQSPSGDAADELHCGDNLAGADSAVAESEGAESSEWASAEWDSDEWRSAEWRNPDPDPAGDSASAPAAAEAAAPESDLELALDAIDGEPEAAPIPQAFSELENVDTDAFLRSVTGHMQPVVVPAHPVVVPGSYQFVKRWKFALIVAGVWVLSAAAGLGFYFWWYTALE